MKVVKQYELSLEPTQKLKIPFNSAILSMEVLKDKPVLMILTDDNYSKTIDRTFKIVAVDKEVQQRFNESHWIGCFKLGPTFAHVFEEL